MSVRVPQAGHPKDRYQDALHNEAAQRAVDRRRRALHLCGRRYGRTPHTCVGGTRRLLRRVSQRKGAVEDMAMHAHAGARQYRSIPLARRLLTVLGLRYASDTGRAAAACCMPVTLQASCAASYRSPVVPHALEVARHFQCQCLKRAPARLTGLLGLAQQAGARSPLNAARKTLQHAEFAMLGAVP